MIIDLDRQTVSSDDGKVVITFATVVAVAEDARGFGEDYLVDKARSLREEINRKMKEREEQIGGNDGND